MNEMLVAAMRINHEKIPGNSYLLNLPAVTETQEINFTSPVTFFVGENGSGKSTILEALAVACGFNPEGGTKNFKFSTYDSHSPLHKAVVVSRGYRRPAWGYFLRAESFYNVATKTVEYNKGRGGLPNYHNMSHGESFLKLSNENMQKNGLYILDEPEAALSPGRQLSLLVKIHDLAKKGAQFIIATHSPILTGLPGAEILSFGPWGIEKTTYEQTDIYRVTKRFVNDRERFLKELL